MNILFVLGDLERGGAQRVATILANNFSSEGAEVTIAVLLSIKETYIVNDNINVIHLGTNNRNYIKSAPVLIKRLRKLIKDNAFDVIISFVGRVNIISYLANIKTNVPIIVSERNDPRNDNRRAIEVLACKYIYNKVDLVVFQTNYQKDYYNLNNNKGVVIGNPIAFKPYYGIHEQNNIVCLGKLMPQKNMGLLINAFKIATEETCIDNTNLYIYGSGPQEDELKELISSLEMNNRIEIKENIAKVEDILRDNKYFIIASKYEGLSNALLEAMTTGMICISSNWNGVNEIILDEANGFIAEVDDVVSLKNKIIQAIKIDDNEKKEIACRSIESVIKFQEDNIIRIWKENINKLIH